MILQPFQGKETVSYKEFTEALGKQAREFLDEKEGLRQVKNHEYNTINMII